MICIFQVIIVIPDGCHNITPAVQASEFHLTARSIHIVVRVIIGIIQRLQSLVEDRREMLQPGFSGSRSPVSSHQGHGVWWQESSMSSRQHLLGSILGNRSIKCRQGKIAGLGHFTLSGSLAGRGKGTLVGKSHDERKFLVGCGMVDSVF